MSVSPQVDGELRFVSTEQDVFSHQHDDDVYHAFDSVARDDAGGHVVSFQEN
jgi:hypothetical protein